MPHKILFVDSELSVRNSFERALRQEGFDVLTEACGREALRVATKEIVDLLIVDLHLADVQVHELCKSIRDNPRSRSVPILTISANDPQGLAVQCLNNGADGHLAKHITTPELVANIRALLRRPRTYVTEHEVIQKGGMVLRPSERRALFQNSDIESLTPKEYELLKELLLHSPRIVEKDALAMKVWGVSFEQLGRKTLDVHIQRLRKKLGPTAALFLKTVSLVGYQWLEEAPSNHR